MPTLHAYVRRMKKYPRQRVSCRVRSCLLKKAKHKDMIMRRWHTCFFILLFCGFSGNVL